MVKSRKFAAHPVIIILLLFICTRTNAQISDEADVYSDRIRVISVGGIVGGNFCQVDGDSYAGYYKTGLNVGGIGYARVYKNVALSFELLYSQRGARDNGVRYSPVDSATLITKYNINVAYAEIPLMINYFDKRKSHFGLGVSYGRLLSTRESMSLDTASSLMVDFTKYPFRSTSIDAVASAQMHIWKGLFFNIRFQYGLIPMRTDSPPGLSRSNRQFNNLWSVRLMYVFI